MLITRELQLKSLSDRELELLRIIIGYHLDGITEITNKKLTEDGLLVANFSSALIGLAEKGYLSRNPSTKRHIYTLNILNENI